MNCCWKQLHKGRDGDWHWQILRPLTSLPWQVSALRSSAEEGLDMTGETDAMDAMNGTCSTVASNRCSEKPARSLPELCSRRHKSMMRHVGCWNSVRRKTALASQHSPSLVSLLATTSYVCQSLKQTEMLAARFV